jgi:hypothetical protein
MLDRPTGALRRLRPFPGRQRSAGATLVAPLRRFERVPAG